MYLVATHNANTLTTATMGYNDVQSSIVANEAYRNLQSFATDLQWSTEPTSAT